MPGKKKDALPQTFIDATNMMSTEELRNEILKSTSAIDEILDEREGNEKFQALKSAYSDANAGYRDGINAEKAKIEYAKVVLKGRGQTVPAPEKSSSVGLKLTGANGGLVANTKA